VRVLYDQEGHREISRDIFYVKIFFISLNEIIDRIGNEE
jgi:hypothetical protein